ASASRTGRKRGFFHSMTGIRRRARRRTHAHARPSYARPSRARRRPFRTEAGSSSPAMVAFARAVGGTRTLAAPRRVLNGDSLGARTALWSAAYGPVVQRRRRGLPP